MYKVIGFVALLLGMSCNKKTQPNSMTNSYQTIAYEKLGKSIQFLENADQSLVLCYQQTKPGQKTRFLVMDKTKQTIVHEQSIGIGGKVEWHDPTHIKIIDPPGVYNRNSGPNSYTYFFNVLTKERTKANK